MSWHCIGWILFATLPFSFPSLALTTIATTTSFFGRSQSFPLSYTLSVIVLRGGLELGESSRDTKWVPTYRSLEQHVLMNVDTAPLNSVLPRSKSVRRWRYYWSWHSIQKLDLRKLSSPLPHPPLCHRRCHRRGSVPCLHCCCLRQSLTHVHRLSKLTLDLLSPRRGHVHTFHPPDVALARFPQHPRALPAWPPLMLI